MSQDFSRKNFLTLAGFALLGSRCDIDSFSQLEAMTQKIPHRVLGKTGVKLPMIGLGGSHLGNMSSAKEATAIIHLGIDMGLKFIDTAHCYQGGYSEELIGKALKGRRQKTFLMTKTHSRTARGAEEEINASLNALQTDVIDLIQFHNVMYNSDVDRIFSEKGAIKAALKAQKAGKVRFIGLTGHYVPAVQKYALKHHKYLDTIQIPINLLDASQKDGYVQSVMPLAVKHNVGVIAMKTLVKGKLIRGGMATAKQCLHYAWSQPVAMLVSGIDRKKYLVENINHAKGYQKMNDKEQKRLVKLVAAKTRPSLEHYRKNL